MVAAYHPARWQALCAAIGAPELASDPRFSENRSRLQHREMLLRLLEARMVAHPRAFWLEKFTAVDIICGPINNYAEVAQSAPFAEAALAESLQHPVAGRVTLPRSVIGEVGERPRARRVAPTLGQHTREVLAELGMSSGAIDLVIAANTPQS
jgi:crotonobetainyl-CoA:carnitine CoA-transferase CaiB-like acyl-CoA transferase